jgi:hypothetical protein
MLTTEKYFRAPGVAWELSSEYFFAREGAAFYTYCVEETHEADKPTSRLSETVSPEILLDLIGNLRFSS